MYRSLLPALDALMDEPDLVSALWSSFDLHRFIANGVSRRHTSSLVRAITSRDAYRNDFLFHITALGVIGRLGGPHARAELLAVAYTGDPRARPYSARALAGNITAESVPALCALIQAQDPFIRMCAQEALISAAPRSAAAVAVQAGLLALVEMDSVSAARIAAIECFEPRAGAEPAIRLLRRITSDKVEQPTVRAAAVRALGRLGDLDSVPLMRHLALDNSADKTRSAAAEALASLGHGNQTGFLLANWVGSDAPRHALQVMRPGRRGSGLHIAQLVTHSTGGLSTLIAGLAAAFARRHDVDSVSTITCGDSHGPNPASPDLLRLQLDGEGMAWDHLLRIERGLDYVFRSGRPDVLHLRFADVGTLAGARWAAGRGIPTYFTFAPDPLVPMRMSVEQGLLTRETLAEYDARDRIVARTSILHHMAQSAAGIALLPRADRAVERLSTLTFAGPARRIAEGIDLHAVERGDGADIDSVRGSLENAYAPGYGHGLAARRRGLPVLVSVGRLHPIKGLAQLVKAWAGTPDLARSVNLVIVGGNAEDPDPVERAVLKDIAELVRSHPEAAGGLLMTGSIPHGQVQCLLRLLAEGISGFSAPRPLYVCPSVKEEFGLAILEALAVGIPVVGPRVGGPATYLRDGELGFLADTTDPDALSSAIRRALYLRDDPGAYDAMSTAGRHMVRERYSVDRMADDLLSLYRAGAVARLSTAS